MSAASEPDYTVRTARALLNGRTVEVLVTEWADGAVDVALRDPSEPHPTWGPPAEATVA